MTWLREVWRRLRSLAHRDELENRLDEELRFHLEQQTARNLRAGMSSDEARRQALIRFGGTEGVKERTRDEFRAVGLENWLHDVSYSVRSLCRAPGFTAVAILTIALGIGANTAMFSVVNAVLLKPLPYTRDAARLVRLITHVPPPPTTGLPGRFPVTLSTSEVAELRLRAHTITHAGILSPVSVALSGRDDAARLQGTRTSAEIFSMIQAQPVIGRAFTAQDEVSGAAAALILSDGAWRRYFGGDVHIVGRTVTLDSAFGAPRRRTEYMVVGIMGPDFAFPTRQTEFWVSAQPPTSGVATQGRGAIMARLADGISLQTAEIELSRLIHDIRQPDPSVRYELVREQDEVARDVRPALVVLMASVGVVLLIAAVNLANLLLARASARYREMAIRAALGAGPARLLSHSLSESAVLSLAGGIAGLGLAFGGIRFHRWLANAAPRFDLGPAMAFPRLDEIAIDGSVLAFTAAVSIGMSGLVGLISALPHSALHPVVALGRTTGLSLGSGDAPRRTRLRRALVIAQIAMAVVLLVGGGLLLQSVVRLSRVDGGYNAANVLTLQVNLPIQRYPDARQVAFAEEVVARIRQLPQVEAAGYANQLPMVQLKDTAGGLWKTPDAARGPSATGPDARLVSQDFLDVMGVRVVAGRAFRETDGAYQPRVMLINQALASREFLGENPIGRSMYIGSDLHPWQIVGIVEDIRQFRLDRTPEPQFFIDLRQWSGMGVLFPVSAYYAVRVTGNPLSIVASVRQLVRATDDQAAIFNVATMEEVVDLTLATPRMYAVLLGAFAAVGLALALIGIYGVMTYWVTQRTREIGVRMALGAQRTDVVGLVLRQSLLLTGLGIGVGLAAATLTTRFLRTMLFGITPVDPPTFMVIALTFALVATGAAMVPVRRAINIDPLMTLRSE